MRIDKFEVYQVAMPLIYPWRTAYGEDPEIHSVLVKATSGNHTAWSESSPLYAPMYLPESAGSVFYNVSEFFAPFIFCLLYTSDAARRRLRCRSRWSPYH